MLFSGVFAVSVAVHNLQPARISPLVTKAGVDFTCVTSLSPSACLPSQLRSLGSHKMSGYKNPHFSSSWSPDPQVSQGQMAGKGGSYRLQLLLSAARLTSQTLIHLISELKPQGIFLAKAERTPPLPKAILGEKKIPSQCTSVVC